MNEATENRNAVQDPRPRYLCCHPNAKGTGCAVSFEMHPAHGFTEGSVFATFAAQKTLASADGDGRLPATFDWENRITVRFSVNEVAEFLEVFRGYREKLGDGKGLFHKTAKASTVISLEHRLEPSPGYMLSISRKSPDSAPRRMGVLLSMKEAIVLSEALAGSIACMAFGIPRTIGRSASPAARPAASGAGLKDVA